MTSGITHCILCFETGCRVKRGYTANETSYEVFYFRNTLSAITELSDRVFYKADGNISATVTPAGDRRSVWNRI
jgi:hypothetical protein